MTPPVGPVGPEPVSVGLGGDVPPPVGPVNSPEPVLGGQGGDMALPGLASVPVPAVPAANVAPGEIEDLTPADLVCGAGRDKDYWYIPGRRKPLGKITSWNTATYSSLSAKCPPLYLRIG